MPLLSKKFHEETLADRRLLHEHVRIENAAREKVERDLANISALQHDQIKGSVDAVDALHAIQKSMSILNQRVSELASKATWQIAERNGITFFLDSRSLVDKCILENGFWEEEQVEYFTSTARKCAGGAPFYFLDIGSYFGYYSLIFNKYFPDSRVFTFEANPMTYIQLKANLLCNNLHEKITALNAVVSAKSGKTSVSNHDDLLENRGGWSVGGGSGTSATMVDNIVIDEYFSDLEGEFIALKIDVEGYESEVIPGLSNLIKRNKVLIQVECFDFDETLWAKFNKVISGLGLTKINQIQYDHYFTNISDPSLIEGPKDAHVPAKMFFTGLNTRNAFGHIDFDENVKGHIVYGPCMWVRQGSQKIVFRFAKGTVLDNCSMDIFSNYAHSRGEVGVLHSEDITGNNYDAATGELIIRYDHPPSYCDIEFRLVTHGQAKGTFISADICPQESQA